jgi:ribosomal protein L17
VERTSDDLLNITNFGQKSLDEVIAKLDELGLSLADAGSGGSLMPRPRKGPRLGGSPFAREKILANLTSDLIIHGKVVTTFSKAKALRPYAEKMITKARSGSSTPTDGAQGHHQPGGVVKLFDEVAPRYMRPGRWLHPDHQARPRRGDAPKKP